MSPLGFLATVCRKWTVRPATAESRVIYISRIAVVRCGIVLVVGIAFAVAITTSTTIASTTIAFAAVKTRFRDIAAIITLTDVVVHFVIWKEPTFSVALRTFAGALYVFGIALPWRSSWTANVIRFRSLFPTWFATSTSPSFWIPMHRRALYHHPDVIFGAIRVRRLRVRGFRIQIGFRVRVGFGVRVAGGNLIITRVRVDRRSITLI
mmetsp:Transcript_3654/g.9578  ORF Transcript_3654/g.9578 Transcript_3654/m.9578 type:complete len:208 (+) Transcript_3654:1240-1863(+)